MTSAITVEDAALDIGIPVKVVRGIIKRKEVSILKLSRKTKLIVKSSWEAWKKRQIVNGKFD